MNNTRALFFLAILIGGLSSCEKSLVDEQEFQNSSEDVTVNSFNMPLSTGCEMYINGSFENGSIEAGNSGTAAFSNNKVDRWGTAYGTADNWDYYDGINPYSGNKLAHMQRYKGNANYYESIYLKMPIKTKNSYEVKYRMRGGDLKMEVFVFNEVEPVNFNSIIPNYIDDLGNSGFSNIGVGSQSGDSWGLRTHSFTNKSGNLVFIPSSTSISNPNRMLLDKVELTCEYGYLDEIYAEIVQTTSFGYKYQFDTEICEDNPYLSYLWTFSYLDGGFSSQSKSPIIHFPFPIAKPYKVEACLQITDRDGCCVEKCIIFEIGSEIEQIHPVCNYSICLADWYQTCELGTAVHVLTDEGWQRILYSDDFVSILDKKVNDLVTSKGFDPVTTTLENRKECRVTYVVECSPVPISIEFACLDIFSDFEEPTDDQIEIADFEQDCTADCE
ncbi:hypothetical protein N9B82_05840 [Saprospiraceae bacterium]|nr:hypothetical protein [Saprospiraceae bacterium]